MIGFPVEPPITEYLHAKAAKLGIPLSGTFEVTPCCNMACKMCYVRMTQKEQEGIAPLRSVEEWLEIGRQAKEAGMLYLLVTGGEPFLRKDFKEIFQGLHRLGLILSINSNGTMIDEKTVEWLKETPPTRINITLYGASDETYEKLCGNPKGFSQTVKAIHLLKEAGISIRINCSLTPHNAADMEKIYAFAKEEQLLVQATSYMFPPLRRNENMVGENERFTPEETAYYSAKILLLQNGEEWFLSKVENGELPPLPTTDEECPEIDLEGEGIRCRAGKCSFWISWQGKFMACGIMPEIDAPNIFEVGFEKAWEDTKKRVSLIRLPGKCKICNARDNCRSCAAMVYTETGNFHTVPEYRCEMSRVYPDICKQLAEEIKRKKEKKI